MNPQYLSKLQTSPKHRTNIDHQGEEPLKMRRSVYPQQQQQQQQQHWSINSLASLLPNGNEYWSSLASLLGLLALGQTLVNNIFPPYLRRLLFKFFNRLFGTSSLSSYCNFDIAEYEGSKNNELYEDVQLYLGDCPSISTASRVRLARIKKNSSSHSHHSSSSASPLTMSPSTDEPLRDSFSGTTATWQHIVTQSQSNNGNYTGPEKRRFTLQLRKTDRAKILDSYLDHIMKRAAEIRRKNKTRLLYKNSGGWDPVTFKHPSTFETMALDPNKKSEIMADLRSFTEGQDFYEKTGRAWKRGYLLYGPPGTGKSSMIAAMANYLGYDVFDLELTEVRSNSMLRTLLMKTTPKSIIVIEDIDCSIDLTNRSDRKKPSPRNEPMNRELGCIDYGVEYGSKSITLSGLLNCTDGLWSCCGNERIFVFTTNHVQNIDPALLRCGRMDMHIHMGYCTFPALKILLKNYMDVEVGSDLGDGVMKELEVMVDLAEMTPAEISEVLIKNRANRNKAISELLRVLKEKVERQHRKTDKVMHEGKNSGGEDHYNEEEYQEKRALENAQEVGLEERTGAEDQEEH